MRKAILLHESTSAGTDSGDLLHLPLLVGKVGIGGDELGNVLVTAQDAFGELVDDNLEVSFDEGVGKKIDDGTATFASLEKYMLEKGDSAPNVSGRQEYLENLINQYV